MDKFSAAVQCTTFAAAAIAAMADLNCFEKVFLLTVQIFTKSLHGKEMEGPAIWGLRP